MKGFAAAVIALTLTGTASAVPIVMNLSGELVSRSTARPGEVIEFDDSVAGTAFSAQFVIELDDFGAPQFTDTTGFQRWTYTALTGATGISAHLSIGGVAVDLTPYDRSRALVSAIDSKGPIPRQLRAGRTLHRGDAGQLFGELRVDPDPAGRWQRAVPQLAVHHVRAG